MTKTLWIVVAATTAFLAGCSKEKEKETEPVVPVQVEAVQKGPIDRVINAEGVLRAIDQSAIMPKISAPVSKFYVNRGDHVHKGQLLAVLENRDLQAAVTDSRGTYNQALATYRNTAAATVPDETVKAQQDVDAAKQQLDAAQTLLKNRQQMFNEGALARKLVDDAAVAYAQAKSQYETAQKHLQSVESVSRQEEVKAVQGQAESAKGKLEAAQAQLSYSEIRSPMDGVIADRAVWPGEMAAAGSPLLTVMNLSSVIARVNIPATEATHVRVGQPATVISTDRSLTTEGKVTVVSPAIDPNSTTLEVWVQAPNPGERFHAGGTVHVGIHAETIPDATLVPASAILSSSEGGGDVVMVVGADSVAHEHKVQIGVRQPDVVQIISGVTAGERVVTTGGIGLQDGAKVRVEKPGESEDKDKDKDKDDDKGAKGKGGEHE